MTFRLGVIIMLLGLVITSWLSHWQPLVAISTLLTFFALAEIAMFEIVGCSKFNLVVGRANEAVHIKTEGTSGIDWVCVPVHIKIFIWEARGIDATVESGGFAMESELRDRQGRTPWDTTFDLTYDRTGGWIPLACRQGDLVYIGNPDKNKPLEKQTQYPLKLILHCRNTVVSRDFVLSHDMTLREAN